MSFYTPSQNYISNITLGQQTVVEFSSPHDFSVGEIISFRVSKRNGTVEMNNQQSTVLESTTFTVTVPIDSLNYTPFVNPMTILAFPAQAVPSASGIRPGLRPASTVLVDCFDNVPVN